MRERLLCRPASSAAASPPLPRLRRLWLSLATGADTTTALLTAAAAAAAAPCRSLRLGDLSCTDEEEGRHSAVLRGSMLFIQPAQHLQQSGYSRAYHAYHAAAAWPLPHLSIVLVVVALLVVAVLLLVLALPLLFPLLVVRRRRVLPILPIPALLASSRASAVTRGPPSKLTLPSSPPFLFHPARTTAGIHIPRPTPSPHLSPWSSGSCSAAAASACPPSPPLNSSSSSSSSLPSAPWVGTATAAAAAPAGPCGTCAAVGACPAACGCGASVAVASAGGCGLLCCWTRLQQSTRLRKNCGKGYSRDSTIK